MIIEIAERIKENIIRNLEDEIAISFSGGVDSTLLATIAKKYSNVYLYTAGTENSKDLEWARKIAKELNLNLKEIILNEERILGIYGKIYSFYPGSLLKIEIGIPIYAVCEEAKKDGLEVMLFGSGTEELFVGYNRYYTYFDEGKDLHKILVEEFKTLKDRDIAMIKKIANKIGIEARFPFYDLHLAEMVWEIPLNERMKDKEKKKGVLRDAAKFLDVPEDAINRPKKAAQYGSGVHKIVLKHSNELNKKYPQKI